jgi:hypothetical protein
MARRRLQSCNAGLSFSTINIMNCSQRTTSRHNRVAIMVTNDKTLATYLCFSKEGSIAIYLEDIPQWPSSCLRYT